MHLTAKMRGAIEEARGNLHGSSGKGKQCLTTFNCIVEDVIKDKEAEVSNDVKKTSWTNLNKTHKDVKDLIISEVVRQIKDSSYQHPQYLNSKDWIIQHLLRKR